MFPYVGAEKQECQIRKDFKFMCYLESPNSYASLFVCLFEFNASHTIKKGGHAQTYHSSMFAVFARRKAFHIRLQLTL